MPVYQVEEYYIHMSALDITQEQKKLIKDHLSDESYTNYEFQDNDEVLVIDDIQDESEADNLENEINNIIG